MTKEEKLEIINGRSGFNRHNGITVTDVGEGYSTVEAELKPEAKNPWGAAHGGFVYSLCDVAAGVAVNENGRRCVTLSGSLYYLRPCLGKKLRAEGKIIKDGKTVVVAETNVYNDEGELAARGEFQLFVVEDNR